MNYSKTSRTNIRPLSISIPTHSVTNLRSAYWKKLDSWVSIKDLKEPKQTVEKFIQYYSNKYNVKCLVGPDIPSYFQKPNSKFWTIILDVKNHIKTHIEYMFGIQLNDEQIYRLELLFPNVPDISNVSHYFIKVINDISKYLKKPISAKSYVELLKNKDWRKDDCFMAFVQKSKKHIEAYNIAASMQKSKQLEENELPYFYISTDTGIKRQLTYGNLEHILANPDKIIAPKVLTINDFEDLIIPNFISGDESIKARKYLQTTLEFNSNYYLKDFDWTVNVSKIYNPLFNLSKDEQSFWHFKKKLLLSELVEIYNKDIAVANILHKNEIFNRFVRIESYKTLNQHFYPWIFFIANGNLFVNKDA